MYIPLTYLYMQHAIFSSVKIYVLFTKYTLDLGVQD